MRRTAFSVTGVASSTHFLLIACTAVVTAPIALPARAADGNLDSLQLEEVVVTARKRTEPLQTVPISATVVSGAVVSDENISSIQDLTRTIPSVQLAQGTTSNRQIIRGIGSGDNPSFEQSVGTFVDDVYHGRSRTSEADLFDLDRVEVLKGPQTTYFGNNAIAGALSELTHDPGNTFGGYMRGAYTPQFNGYTYEGAVDLPAGNQLAARIAGQFARSDGWIDDIGAGQHIPNTQNAGIRGTLLWNPSDDLTVRFKAQHTSEHQSGGLPIVRNGCPQPANFGPTTGFCADVIAAGDAPYSADFTRNSSPEQSTRLATDDYNAKVTYDTGPVTLTSVTAYTHYTYALDDDLDLSPLDLMSLIAPEKYQQFSQELRLTSNTHGALDYLAGAYYQHSDLSVQNALSYGFLNPTIENIAAFSPLVPYLPLATNDNFAERNNTESAFAALTWHIAPKLQLTAALRYTDVAKDFNQSVGVATGNFTYAQPTPLPSAVAGLAAAFARSAGLATPGYTQLSRDDNHLSRSAALQYEAASDVMLYARYDNGFKAGGFNGVDLSDGNAALAFAPETVNAYELGAKNRLFDNRVTLNVALFRSIYSNLQLAGVVPSVSGAYVNRVQNAGGAISQGVELETEGRITRNLRMSLSLAYLDAYYTRYPNATATAEQSLAGIKFQDLTGQTTPFAPRWSADWSVTYETPVAANLKLRLQNDLFYRSAELLNFNNDPYSVQGGYAREDLTLALASAAGWELAVIGKNLTDRTIRTYGAAYPTSLGSYVYMTEPPRNVTIQLKYEF
jgi:iron complex outermembrane recepter protein